MWLIFLVYLIVVIVMFLLLRRLLRSSNYIYHHPDDLVGDITGLVFICLASPILLPIFVVGGFLIEILKIFRDSEYPFLELGAWIFGLKYDFNQDEK